MAGDLCNAFENTVADYIGTQCTYVGLLTAISDAETPTITECADGNYARQAVTWGAAVNGVAANTNAIAFPAAAAGITCVGVALYGAISGGTAKVVKSISSTPVTAGTRYTIDVGALTVGAD